MPKHLSYLEEKIKRIIKDRINRGRVEIYINLEYIGESGIEVKVDIPLAKAYKAGLEALINELTIDEDVKLSHILGVSEIIKTERKELDEDIIWNCLEIALKAALDSVIDMRIKQGLVLKKDMEAQLIKVEGMIDNIEERSPLVVLEYKEKLKERIKELLDVDCNIDEERLNYEVVFFADKSDINEEVVRLKSHTKQFLKNLDKREPVGRKLDFLIQEMNREVNTIDLKLMI